MSRFILKNYAVRQKLATPFHKETESGRLSDSPKFTTFADLKGHKSEILTKSIGCSLWLVSQPLTAPYCLCWRVSGDLEDQRKLCGGRG